MFTTNDLQQIKKRGNKQDVVESQIKNFENGFPFTEIIKPATVGDGIISLSQKQVDRYSALYENALKEKKVLKFVPASGAASRMFKDLFEFMTSYKNTDEEYKKFINDKDFKSPANFFGNLENFAFYKELNETVEKSLNQNLTKAFTNHLFCKILEALLTEKGMNYGNLPKGLLKFHKYGSEQRTPTEEHLVEGAKYCNNNGRVKLHFTVSPEHREAFEKHINQVITQYEENFKLKYEITFSEQKASTDTIAVDMNNKPFRNNDNSLLFRPGGHGALIENLNEHTDDIIFIKNIDNVVPDHLKEPTYAYKKALAGLLISFQTRIFDYLHQLDNIQEISDELVEEIHAFLSRELCLLPTPKYQTSSKEEKIKFLKNKLNSPIRVCGMVKNDGEPGGGPFWVVNTDKTTSLQIVESSQIDPKNAEKQQILKSSTHFNPVDLVCAPINYKGEKFDLPKYIDPNTGFISKKSKDGKDLKALELPGLWNGAMAYWNTIFVEVPAETFNPVKIVNDLLRPQHQEA